jgi:hypothetical protein
MDKNGKVQVIPLSKDYTENYDNIRWDSFSPSDKVKIYDPFLDGPMEELVPQPVKQTFVGWAQPIPAVSITTTWAPDSESN